MLLVQVSSLLCGQYSSSYWYTAQPILFIFFSRRLKLRKQFGLQLDAEWHIVQLGMLHHLDEASDLGVPVRMLLAVLLHILESILQCLVLLDRVAKLEVLVMPKHKASIHMESEIFPREMIFPVVKHLPVCGSDNVPHWIGVCGGLSIVSK